ncbi:MAG: hypothetical protein CMH98_14135 [Oceanospirillaceae bacterium]|nr:hypothetical protein [Oceanospirillaceae bacterium]
MTLRQQFSLLTGLLVVILLAGNLVLTISNGRDYFQQQLNARAYDAATSLAPSMSQMTDQDTVQLSRLIDVLFDRGFFSAIEFHPVNGDAIHRRSREALATRPAPAWFMASVDFDMTPAQADVTRQWQRLGTVTVTSHTDFAYRDLWAMVRSEMIWFAWVLVLSLGLLHLLLNWLFRPVLLVEKQALAICEREWQVQENIPRARELRRMVLAMNKMVLKLQSIFSEQSAMTEQLREESFQDPLTGVLNRRGFDERLAHILQREEEHSGLLVLLQLGGLAEFNRDEGRQAADDLLQLLGSQIREATAGSAQAFAGRRSGTDFAVYLPCSDSLQADELLHQVHSDLLTSVLTQRNALVFHLGGVFLQNGRDDPSHALSCADAALRQAQRHPDSTAQLYDGSSADKEWTAGEWRTLLTEALASDALSLQFMPVLCHRNNRILQYEVLTRLSWQDEIISAARFWPMVEQHQLAARYDLAIIARVIRQLVKQPPRPDVRYCVNLSAASVLDDEFHHQLQSLLAESPELAGYLALEVAEPALPGAEAALARLAMVLRPFRIALGVDQVGTGNMAFAYLQRLPLDYIRIDGSFNRGLHQAQDRKFFIQSMVQIAHNLDLLVLGEGVEENADVAVLRQTGVDGMSGYYFSRPLLSLSDAHQWQPPSE